MNIKESALSDLTIKENKKKKCQMQFMHVFIEIS